ncbi:MAG: hypothetical protein ABSD63_17830 [Candidatus Korobacteraceae bacterium]|jgi:hypothetical protein
MGKGAISLKLAHLQHEEWLARRAKVTDASIAKAMEILDRPTKGAPETGDELPQGYVSVHHRYSHNSRRA